MPFSKWYTEHLPIRALLKPRPPKSQLKALEMTSYYTSAMFYAIAVLVALSFFGVEIYEKKKQDTIDQLGGLRVVKSADTRRRP